MRKQGVSKKMTSLVLVLLIVMGLAAPAMATPSDISVYIDGRRINFEVPPQMIGGRTMIPLRAIFEEMGANVEWDATTQTATATRGNITVVLSVGSLSPTVNGVVVPIDQAGVIVDGRTLAPLRFVAEAFGGEVLWDDATRTANIVTNAAVAQRDYARTTFNELLRLGYSLEQAQDIFEQEMFTLFNEWRVARRVAPFIADDRFAGTSRAWAVESAGIWESFGRNEITAERLNELLFGHTNTISATDWGRVYPLRSTVQTLGGLTPVSAANQWLEDT